MAPRKKDLSAPAAPLAPRKRAPTAKAKAALKPKGKATKQAGDSSDDSESEEDGDDTPRGSFTKIPIK
jgi:hypothetical protein